MTDRAERVSIMRDGKAWGTFPAREVKLLIQSKHLVATDLARTDDTQDWQQLHCLAEFSSLFTPQGEARSPVRARETKDLAASGPHWLEARLGPRTIVGSIALLCIILGLAAYFTIVGHGLQVGVVLAVLVAAAFIALFAKGASSRPMKCTSASLTIATDSDEAGLGGLLEGEVELVAIHALEDCYFELSMTLLAEVVVLVGESPRPEIRWVAICDPMKVLFPRRTVDLAAGERRKCRFSIHAPTHDPAKARVSGYTAVRAGGDDLQRTLKMTAAELLREKRTMWMVEVQAMGVDGDLIAEKFLRVSAQASRLE